MNEECVFHSHRLNNTIASEMKQNKTEKNICKNKTKLPCIQNGTCGHSNE